MARNRTGTILEETTIAAVEAHAAKINQDFSYALESLITAGLSAAQKPKPAAPPPAAPKPAAKKTSKK